MCILTPRGRTEQKIFHKSCGGRKNAVLYKHISKAHISSDRCPSRSVTSPLTLDTNTAHPLLSISDDLRSVTRVTSRLPCASHHERFDHWPQVLTAQTFSSGTHYWELEAEGFWDIGVCYRSIGRKGKDGNAFGINKVQVPFCICIFLYTLTCLYVNMSCTYAYLSVFLYVKDLFIRISTSVL